MPESSKPLQPLALLAYGLVAIGMAVVAVGLSWKAIVPDTVFWSEEDQQAYTDAHLAAHTASIPGRHDHQHANGESNAQDQAETLDPEQAKREYQSMRDRLSHAQSARNRYGQYLAIAGVLLATGGMVLLRKLKPASPGDRA